MYGLALTIIQLPLFKTSNSLWYTYTTCDRCEVTNVVEEDSSAASPIILYDLFGTVNHIGTLQSGHYVNNVNVNGQWFNCNDAHVSRAGTGDGEEAVLSNDGAYLLFYIRR